MLQPYRFAGAIAALLMFVGCQTAPPAANRTTVASQLVPRFGQTLPDHTIPGQFACPPGVSVDDGLTEDEAIAIALWNNAAFQELLADLGIARGDLVQAGLLPNPEVLYYFSAPEKPFRYLVDFPIEAIWLRPMRVRSAANESGRVAERLSQAGLDLIRDVRLAYADTLLAQARLEVAKKTVELRSDIRKFAEKRLKNGDISEQEATTARVDALQGEQDLVRAGFDVPLAEERLKNLLGMGTFRASLNLLPPPLPPLTELPIDDLVKEASATRPDALSSARAVTAAQARVRIAKVGWIRFLGIMDGTNGVNGHEFGPAFRVTLPIFNRNQGGIARAEAELERALRNQQTVANQIILDVQRSYLLYRQSASEIEALRAKVRPEVEAAISRARTAYQAGDVAIFIVLESTRQLIDSYLREAVLNGDLRRTWAELERSVGRKLLTPEQNVPATPPVPQPVPTPTTPPATPPAPKQTTMPILSLPVISTPATPAPMPTLVPPTESTVPLPAIPPVPAIAPAKPKTLLPTPTETVIIPSLPTPARNTP